jgi:hypothetical protein
MVAVLIALLIAGNSIEGEESPAWSQLSLFSDRADDGRS